jgi:hypothetical protein
MTNSATSAAPLVDVRPLFDLFRPAHRRPTSLEAATTSHLNSVWDTLALVLRQQLSQDALLLWQHDRRRDDLRLLTSFPSNPSQADITICATSHLAELASGRLEAVAHVHCAHSSCPTEQTLWHLGLHSGLTTSLADEGDSHLLTLGFRESWQLVAHHTPAAVALASYIRECRSLVAPLLKDQRWWELPSEVPHLWRQPYRPSIMRTVYDLNEIFVDLADRGRLDAPPRQSGPATQVARMAHRAGDLMARLENVYLDGRPTITTEELLSEAVLLVRGAYLLSLGCWPGCLAAASHSPQSEQGSPAAIRQSLIDWVLREIEGEQE